MKRIFLLIMCLSLLSPVALAQEESPYPDINPNIKQNDEDGERIDTSAPAERIWQGEQYQNIQEEYGSNQSPSFEGRGKINPNEADYGYGSSDGY